MDFGDGGHFGPVLCGCGVGCLAAADGVWEWDFFWGESEDFFPILWVKYTSRRGERERGDIFHFGDVLEEREA